MKLLKHIKLLFVLVGIGITFTCTAQQMPLYTNYLLNNYAYNPAVAGSEKQTKASLNYRDQWTGFKGAPKTFLVSVHGPLKKAKNVALGGLVLSDQAGLLTRTSGYLSFTYHLKLSKKTTLAAGLSGGMVQYRVKLYDKIIYDEDDNLLYNNVVNANTYDANAGIYLYHDKFFFGASALQLLNNRVKFKKEIESKGNLMPHIYATAGYNIKCGKNFVLQPMVMFKMNDPLPFQMEYALKGTYKNVFWIGALYRDQDAICPMVGFNIKDFCMVAYSFDYTLSSFQKYNRGTNEFNVTFKFGKKKKTKGEKATDAEEEEFNTIDNSIKSNLKNKKKPATDAKDK
jgi:type IX secretion system PorP/SprF family membrane protein